MRVGGEHITNPHKKKRKRKKKYVSEKLPFGQVDFQDIQKTTVTYHDKELSNWVVKDFAFWFADCLENHFPEIPEYQVVYKRDCRNIATVKTALEDNGFSADMLKDFIKYAVEECAQNVINHKLEVGDIASFTTRDLVDLINPYMQQLSFGQHSKEEDNAIQSEKYGIITASELKAQWKKNKLRGLLRNYGIPITVTYITKTLLNDNGDVIEKLATKIRSVLKKLDNTVLERIAQQSMLREPYNNQFEMLDWQKLFEDIWSETEIKKRQWWSEQHTLDENREWWFNS